MPLLTLPPTQFPTAIYRPLRAYTQRASPQPLMEEFARRVRHSREMSRSLTIGEESAIDSAFGELTRQWRSETRHLSSVSEMASNNAYQQIIAMGEIALPLIFKDMEGEPDHWFWALTSITGEDPVPPEDRGRVPKMALAWLQWGENHGYRR